MRHVMVFLMATLPCFAARADRATSAPPSETEEMFQVYGLPLGPSAVGLASGATALVLLVGGGALAGAAAGGPLSTMVPTFAPPEKRGAGANAFTGAVMGALLVAPLALAVAVGVDTLGWLISASPSSTRQGLVLLGAQAMVLAFTLPALAVAAGLSGVVTAGARWQQDKLAGHTQRQLVLVALGAGFTVALLAVPMALTGALLRTAAWVVLGADEKEPPHRWWQRLTRGLAQEPR
jgi:MFS family permease